MATPFTIKLRVYIEDTDAGGIVYYVNYLKFMERARTDMLRGLGLGKAALFADQLMFVVTGLECDYVASAVLDDELVVSADVKRVGRSLVVFEQTIKRAGAGPEMLCRGETKVACVSRDTRKPVAMPKALREKLLAISN
ncbi:MAG: YbgC/FadM family acyl-CoA thioesterase [Gammaproteobacteria bacterium]|nr:YbgC/FadM family acyl-CoA thioesterase [Gammaproteobacteria bacterium]NND38712.1 YbgC/FadM family acyl-CoA thioesterase [Pseudomonadales bacterium]MBT8150814.1 YbgC/FadM family acyl-CoA thioesterase [Gammaproteobacteria bacterium]NNL11880.1 YbgC/FadM family acyl-CoA thioesterase [Pseudomonadales bacterium]NNM11543.1 YbgC/FadM family acyl-CoA thioesterase [Pseudomonadales bacterium]